jgi:hypothetical protein
VSQFKTSDCKSQLSEFSIPQKQQNPLMIYLNNYICIGIIKIRLINELNAIKKNMRYYLIFLGILISQAVCAQILENRNLYFKTSGSLGNYFGGKVSIEYVNTNNQSFCLGIYGQGRRAHNVPKDYVPPSGILGQVFLFGLDHPMEERTTYYLATGKVFKLNNSRTRFNLIGGLGCSYLKTPIDFIKTIPQGSSAENYSYNINNVFSLGLVINPSVDFAAWKYFGISVGLISIISKNRFSVGFEASYLIGLVNNRSKKK